MTPGQANLLAFIGLYIDEHGYSPSYEEMRAELGLKSKSGIHRLVTALVERGLVSRLPGRARAITLGKEVAPPPRIRDMSDDEILERAERILAFRARHSSPDEVAA